MNKKTILLTGATGFLGSNLLKYIRNQNYNIILIIRKNSDLYRIKNIVDNCKLYYTENIEKIFLENKIDYIIHTATNYMRNNEKLSEGIDTNIIFPLKLIEYATIKNNNFVFINTDTTLPENINEYSRTKSDFIKYVKLIQEKKNFNFINLKLQYFFGPKDNKNKFIDQIIIKCLKNEDIDLTKGEQQRDFIFIDDVVEVYNLLLKKEKYDVYEEYDVGSGKMYTIKQIVEIIKKKSDSKSNLYFGKLEYRKNELMISVANIKCIKKLGWNQKYDLEESIEKTINYYKGSEFNE